MRDTRSIIWAPGNREDACMLTHAIESVAQQKQYMHLEVLVHRQLTVLDMPAA